MKMSETIIPSSPTDIQKIKNAVIECSNPKLRQEAEKDNIKAIREDVKKQLGVAPKDFNRMVNAYHKQNYSEVVAGTETFTELYEKIFGAE